jgi:hypothetical protein
MDYIIYVHTHNRNGYSHTEYLCFKCAVEAASQDADEGKPSEPETIHPIAVKEGLGRNNCSLCDMKLNWMDT